MFRTLKRIFLPGLLVFVLMAVAVWYLATYTDRIPRDVITHLNNVWHGRERIDGGKTPGELLRHAEKRLSGHTRLETVFLPILHAIQRQVERPVPNGDLPTLGKGQQAESIGESLSGRSTIIAGNADALRQAMSMAKAGQVIELLPGLYRINKRLDTHNPGLPGQPVTVRAAQPGQVQIELTAEEGFRVSQPYWVFENLQLKGVCSEDRYCEHAFHVVGKAKKTVIRNNAIVDFNAHVKVNGEGGEWPDDGLLEFNTLTNTHRRETHLPTTPFDLVGASRWIVADNLVSNFVKGDGDKVSYGLFMKGAGREGRIERNLVICTPKDISQPGVRVGISMGGGGTGTSYCRDGACKAEFFAGVVANNVVAHCNDFGIDVHLSVQTLVAHNTLINTAGIDVRDDPSSALLHGNLLEGRLRARKGGQIKEVMNELGDMKKVQADPDRLDLAWTKKPEKIISIESVPKDFCGQKRADGTLPGAFDNEATCPTKPVHAGQPG